MLDIITPVLNEECILKEKKDYFLKLGNKTRLIFVDGGSVDKTVKIAKQYGTVIHSPSGRGIQKNKGVEAAKGEHILFLHVDTSIEDEALTAILWALNNGAAAGCLTMKIDDSGWLFKIFAQTVNFRAKYFGVIDGDLGFFIKKSIFQIAGQFPLLPYMEDIAFSKKLTRFGKVHPLTDSITVSSRKWHEKGFIQTFVRYMWAYLQLWTGTLK